MTREETFLKYVAQTSPHPLLLDVSRAEGSYIHTSDNKRYLDLISGIAVNNVGHRNPSVLAAIRQQLDRYLHVMAYGEYIQDPVNNYAKKLVGQLPDTLNCLYLVNSGTEANEAAIKLAKRHTGRTQIISFRNSYHGSTQGSLSISGNESKKAAFRPLIPHVSFLHFNEIDELSEINEKTAGVIIEPIQGDAGVIIPAPAFIQALRARCSQVGAMLIFDEIQTGFGRTGKLFAFEHFNVVPDVITMAKAMGGGLPIGGLAANHQIMDDFTHDPMLGHITTFGGNPVSCAAANAVLDVLLEPGFLEETEDKGAAFESELKHPAIRDLRRMGLMIAIEYENATVVERIAKECLEEGVITYFFLSNRNCLRLAPPLTISYDEINLGCRVINNVMSRVLGLK